MALAREGNQFLDTLEPEVIKFNVDGASRGKWGPVGVRGVPRNSNGKVPLMFSKHVRIGKVLAILEAPRQFFVSFQGLLVVESSSSNAFGRTLMGNFRLWKF